MPVSVTSTQKFAHERTSGLGPKTHLPDVRLIPKQSPATAVAVDDGLPTQRSIRARTPNIAGECRLVSVVVNDEQIFGADGLVDIGRLAAVPSGTSGLPLVRREIRAGPFSAPRTSDQRVEDIDQNNANTNARSVLRTRMTTVAVLGQPRAAVPGRTHPSPRSESLSTSGGTDPSKATETHERLSAGGTPCAHNAGSRGSLATDRRSSECSFDVVDLRVSYRPRDGDGSPHAHGVAAHRCGTCRSP